MLGGSLETRLSTCAKLILFSIIGEVPSFEREGSYMAGELQAHRAHLAAAQNLRHGRITVFLFMNHNFKVKASICVYINV